MKRALKIVGLRRRRVRRRHRRRSWRRRSWGASRSPTAAEASGIRIVKDGIVSVGVIPSPRWRSRSSTRGTTRSAKAILAELSRRHLGPDARHDHPDHARSSGSHRRRGDVSEGAGRSRWRPRSRSSKGASARRVRSRACSPSVPPASPVTKTVADGDTLMLGPHRVRVFAGARPHARQRRLSRGRCAVHGGRGGHQKRRHGDRVRRGCSATASRRIARHWSRSTSG